MSEEKEVYFMITSKSKNSEVFGNVRLFGNTKVLAITAVFIAMSIILGKFLSFTAGPFRISFENLTVLMSGIFFGPVVGLVTGAVADLIGCILYGYAINPIITLGAASIGLISGLVSKAVAKDKKLLNTILAVAAAHLIGSVVIKSIGLHVYFNYPFESIILRFPLYLIIGTVESYIIYMLRKNTAFSSQIERMCKK